MAHGRGEPRTAVAIALAAAAAAAVEQLSQEQQVHRDYASVTPQERRSKVAVSDAQRERIIGCSDLGTLTRWLRQAVTVAAGDQLFE